MEESGSDPRIAAIEAYTAGSYSGSDYAFVDQTNRIMYFHSAFLDQDAWTAEVGLNFHMTNPETNFFADESTMTAAELLQYKKDRSF